MNLLLLWPKLTDRDKHDIAFYLRNAQNPHKEVFHKYHNIWEAAQSDLLRFVGIQAVLDAMERYDFKTNYPGDADLFEMLSKALTKQTEVA